MTAVAEMAAVAPAIDDREYEIVNGRKEPKMAGARHGGVCAQIIVELGVYLRQNKIGRVYTPDTTFVIGEVDRLPDVGFVLFERMPAEGEPIGKWTMAPDLAVEIIAPNDLFENVKNKLRDYFAAGVREVWLVEPQVQIITVYTSPTRDRILTEDEELTSALLPGFSCRVGNFFQT
jgi:Uma2 family endonuclease